MTGFFTDSAGNLSSTRAFAAAIIAVVLFNWTYATIKSGAWQPLDLDATLTLAGALAAKVCQKFVEGGGKKAEQTPAREG
jgi:hypothetical protein